MTPDTPSDENDMPTNVDLSTGVRGKFYKPDLRLIPPVRLVSQAVTTPAPPMRQIRAVYDATTIRVYQAYSDAIADSALAHGTFVSPPFKMDRMTWIKPSFLWMMYRAGWGFKDPGQSRILAIDITREGFDWALAHGCPSHPTESMTAQEWADLKARSPVRIQWDPERDLHHNPLSHRAIQIGLSHEAVKLYVHEWIRKITDVTLLAHEIHSLVQTRELERAQAALPLERAYGVDSFNNKSMASWT